MFITKNSNFTLMIVACCFSLQILTSCQSHEQKIDDAFEIVKQEKLISKDSVLDSVEIILETKKIEQVKIIDNVDDWSKFKTETEKKIITNEKKIKELKSIPNTDSKLLKKITNLEKDNNDLRKKMNVYKEEQKVQWENFKTMMNHDVNEIDIELKDISLNNNK